MDEQTLKDKAREMAEKLFEHHGEDKQMVIQHFLPGLEQQVREFYDARGRWPTFRRDPTGHGASIVLE